MANEQEDPESAKGPDQPKGEDEARQYLEDLRKQAGIEDDGGTQAGADETGSDDLLERLKKSEAELAVGNAKLAALSQAYIDLLKNSKSTERKGPQSLADVDDLLRKGRQESGTYYSKEQRQ